MKQKLINEINHFFLYNEMNFFKEINSTYFEEPLIGFADANDKLFTDYKKIIGEYHLTPKEMFELEHGDNSFNKGSVMSIVLPINEKTRISNRHEKKFGSKEWALTRTFGDEIFIKELVKFIKNYLLINGVNSISPYHSEYFKVHNDSSNISSNWSERHIAYATNLGTFSINDGFITNKGIAIKLVSFVIDTEIPHDVRKYNTHFDNCLLLSKNICGACIKRCPVGAITKDGHDKIKCYQHVYGNESKNVALVYGGKFDFGSGCGLCQTAVPCEYKNPRNSY